MEVKFFSVLFILCLSQRFVEAQYDKCDDSTFINAVGGSSTISHKASLGSCRYKVFAPAETFIQATCSISSSCGTHVFYVSRNGEKDLRDNSSYCGTGNVPVTSSVGNEIVVALDTRGTVSASFSCQFMSVALTSTNCDCGWSVTQKIVGGVPTKVNGFVSHAVLVDRPSRDLFCGASLISQYWSLTAAHCFDAFPNFTTSALLVGDHDITTGTDTKWSAAYALASYTKHPGYVSTTSLNDLALVKTLLYVRFTSGVGPACLPYTFNGVSFVGNDLTAVGWGTTSFGGPSSNVLLQTNLRVISNAQCSQNMTDVDLTKICTFGNKTRDTCGKDSGGGLYWSTSNGRQYLIAAVNYGVYCASSFPSVNSRVDRYFSWIESTTKAFFCRK